MQVLTPVFTEISLVIIVAAIVAGLMQLLRQPLIIGHILTGLIAGPAVLNLIHTTDTLTAFSQFGVALLLFIVGLNLSPKIIKEVGRVAIITGISQLIITIALGWWISRLLHFSPIAALYLGIALSFSSTIVILKILSDRHDLDRLYAKISLGILLLQDIVATIMLVLVSNGAKGLATTEWLTQTVIKAGVVIAVLMAVSIFILPYLSRFFAQSQEFLFLFAISWGLGVAALFQGLGFSLAIGALFAGVALASSPYHYEISSRLRPLRDFFVLLFFIWLGSQMAIDQIGSFIMPVITLSLLVLLGKPIMTMLLIKSFGYTAKTAFKSSLTLGQISEFSLILILLGSQLGDLDKSLISIITLITLITIAGSTYLMLYADWIYRFLSPGLVWLDHIGTVSGQPVKTEPEIVLFGYDNVGYDFIKTFKRLEHQFLVVDYDPEIIEGLTRQKVSCQYGDANDNEFLEGLNFKKVRLVVSTISDFETSQLLVQHIRQSSKRSIIILKSDTVEEASLLYQQGATYVMMPHYLSSSYASMLIDKHRFDLSHFIKERERHLEYLEKRQRINYHARAVEP